MHVAPGSKLLRAHGLARIGKKMEARQLVEDQINAGAYKDSPFGVAKYYALIGEKEKAFAWLEQACDIHDSDVVSLKIDSDFASLQSDMRYDEILRRIGLM
jgi:hypothetical protein